MKLFIKSPIIFVLGLLKWSAIFAFVALVRVFALQEYSSFLILLSQCVSSICICFPAICSLTFIDTLFFLMKNKNKSFCSIATILLPFLLVILLLQPFLYSCLQSLSLQSSNATSAIISNASSISHFLQASYSLNSFIRQVSLILDDFRQAYFEGFLRYLFLSFTYLFFLFSFSIFTIKARWKGFNLLTFFLMLRVFVLLYSMMNSAEMELYIFGFSSNQLKGVPSYIVSIVASSLIYCYGIVSRSKKVL